MKVLFVCKWNQGRSQIAEALCNRHYPEYSTQSVGTHTTKMNSLTPLKVCAPLVVKVLKEWHIDVSDKYPKILTENYVDKVDKIVVLCDMSDLPEYLRSSPKILYWPIEDPDGKGYEYHITMRNKIDELIKDSLKQNNW